MKLLSGSEVVVCLKAKGVAVSYLSNALFLSGHRSYTDNGY